MTDDMEAWATTADGRRVRISEDVARAMLAQAEVAQADRVARMPDEASALRAFADAVSRLQEFGWRDPIYCPKDGSSFDVIEAGSSGIHRCHYAGEWPKGHWWVEEAGDLWPSRPTLFRLDPAAAEAERKRMAEVATEFAAKRQAHRDTAAGREEPT